MKKQRILSDKVGEAAPGLWSNLLVVGSQAYIAGLTARQPDGEMYARGEYEQAKVIFQKMKDLLSATGGEMNDIVKLTIFVTNITQNTEVWRARKEFFSGDFPACSLVQVAALAKPDTLVEIEGFAILGCSAST